MSTVIHQRAGDGGTLCWVLGIVRAGDLKEFTTRWRQALYTDVLGAFVKGGTGVVGAIEGAQTRRPLLLLSEGCSGQGGLSRQRRHLSICLEGPLPQEAASHFAWLVLGKGSDRALQCKALLE